MISWGGGGDPSRYVSDQKDFLVKNSRVVDCIRANQRGCHLIDANKYAHMYPFIYIRVYNNVYENYIVQKAFIFSHFRIP